MKLTTNFGFGSYSYYEPQYANPSQKPICTANKCTFPYPCVSLTTCTGYKIELQPGNYIFEVFGGQGGSSNKAEGGPGGHSLANIQIPSLMPVYLFIGAMGSYKCRAIIYGGGGQSSSTGCGGGATDFRIDPTKYSTRFLIAGGGGGALNDRIGGSGGGLIGYNLGEIGIANQTNGYDFGFGYSSGGGGLYGGYFSEGGSGFVYSSNKETNKIEIITSITVGDGYTEAKANYGYGYAIIRYNSRINNALRLPNTFEISSRRLRLMQMAAYSSVIEI